MKDADGHYVTSRLAEDTLAEIARRTGGELFHADSKRFGVEDVERALNNLKRTENEARIVRQYDEIFELLLLPAFLLLIGEACMSERRRRTAINPGTPGGSPHPPAIGSAGPRPAPSTRHGTQVGP